MPRSRLLVVALVSLAAPSAFAQQVIAPYAPETVAPPPPPPAPPVPPPVVVPPPQYGLQPYYYTPPPRACHEELQPRWGLVIAGAAVLGASWSVNAAAAFIADEWKLAVPIAGPFMEIAEVDTSYAFNRVLIGMLVFDGLIETAGAAMLLAGAVTHRRVAVYDKGPTQVAIVPTLGGLAAVGRF
jgi:hypothetical protein